MYVVVVMRPRNYAGKGHGGWGGPRDFRVKTKEIIIVLDFIRNVLSNQFPFYFLLFNLPPVSEQLNMSHFSVTVAINIP